MLIDSYLLSRLSSSIVHHSPSNLQGCLFVNVDFEYFDTGVLKIVKMEKRIQLEKRGKAPDQIKELNLDNCRSTSIVGLTDEFVNLESLSLINVGLTSLKGFPKLPNLKRLELSDNRISNGLNLLHTSPKITYLNLSGNKIKDLETLEPLKELKNLRTLDLFNNDPTNIENYRQKVFNLIPSLKYLDGFDIEDVEAESDDEWEEEDEDGLEAVYKDNLEDDSEEYEGEEEEEDDEEEEDEDEEEDENDKDGEDESTSRGKKRKLEDGGKEDGESKKSNSSAVE